MWSLKVTIQTDDSFLFGKYTKKHNVSLFAYPNSYSIDKNKTIMNGSAILTGKPEDIEEFIKDMKKDSRIINIENEGNLAVYAISEPPKIKTLFDSEFIFEKPPVFNSNGEYIFEIASFSREKLNELLNGLKKQKFKINVSSLKKTKLTHIQAAYIYPNLTEQQKKCFQVALNNGYYEVPRKITLKELGKIVKMSYSTYQFHLRTAEKKIMPFLNKYL